MQNESEYLTLDYISNPGLYLIIIAMLIFDRFIAPR